VVSAQGNGLVMRRSSVRFRQAAPLTGVVVTCRWLAGALVPACRVECSRPWRPSRAGTAAAHPELIEAEALAAELWVARHPRGTDRRPGRLEAILATLTWAWRGVGVPPLEIRSADAC
jgi:hypothetical protein